MLLTHQPSLCAHIKQGRLGRSHKLARRASFGSRAVSHTSTTCLALRHPTGKLRLLRPSDLGLERVTSLGSHQGTGSTAGVTGVTGSVGNTTGNTRAVEGTGTTAGRTGHTAVQDSIAGQQALQGVPAVQAPPVPERIDSLRSEGDMTRLGSVRAQSRGHTLSRMAAEAVAAAAPVQPAAGWSGGSGQQPSQQVPVQATAIGGGDRSTLLTEGLLAKVCAVTYTQNRRRGPPYGLP
jgi:hypothetical protein